MQTFALIFIVCFRAEACAPMLVKDGFPSLTSCQIGGAVAAPQAQGRIKRILCIDSRRIDAVLGRGSA